MIFDSGNFLMVFDCFDFSCGGGVLGATFVVLDWWLWCLFVCFGFAVFWLGSLCLPVSSLVFVLCRLFGFAFGFCYLIALGVCDFYLFGYVTVDSNYVCLF